MNHSKHIHISIHFLILGSQVLPTGCESWSQQVIMYNPRMFEPKGGILANSICILSGTKGWEMWTQKCQSVVSNLGRLEIRIWWRDIWSQLTDDGEEAEDEQESSRVFLLRVISLSILSSPRNMKSRNLSTSDSFTGLTRKSLAPSSMHLKSSYKNYMRQAIVWVASILPFSAWQKEKRRFFIIF